MSSWLRSAVNKAVEVGGNTTTITRAVRTYADTVVGGGAKLIQDRLGSRNLQSYKNAVKRLEEVSVSCRGAERVQLLRRWLVALKEIERFNKPADHQYPHHDSSDDSPQTPTLVLYYDPDLNCEPMNFRHVFLHSQALEGITLSLILEQPNDEEISLLGEIFSLCLIGGKEAHHVTANYVRDLANVFAAYDEEVLAKREELLQYAQDAIAGLKINADLERIDSQVSDIHTKLSKLLPGDEKLSEPPSSGLPIEKLKEALAWIRLCLELEELLLRKKQIKIREPPLAHNEKVDKLKVLSESLASSASKSAKRITENRTQKEEALRFRVAKTSEVSQLELDLSAEIKGLQNRKDDLELELKQVTSALTSAHARLQNAREERDQFDDANDQIIQLFKLKEDELSKSIASYKSEGEVCNTFINFLENSWGFQSKSVQQTQQLVKDELERHEDYFINLATSLLESYKDKLSPSVSSLQALVDDLKRLDGTEQPKDAVNPRKELEEQYQKIETEFLTTFSVVESIKKQFCNQDDKEDTVSRKPNERVKNLLDGLEKIKGDFESIERPKLEIESPTRTGNDGKQTYSLSSRISLPSIRTRHSALSKHVDRLECASMSSKNWRDAEAQLAKLRLELELENHHSRESSMEGLCDWEFDEKIEPRRSI